EQVAIHEQESVEDVIVDEVNVDEVIVSEASSDELLEVADGVVAVSDREGRLYRSVGAEHLPEAIPALTTSQAGRLRTVRNGGPRAADHGAPEIVRISEDMAAPGSLMVIDEMAPAAQPIEEFAPRPAPLAGNKKDGTLTALGVYALVLLVPTIVALLQAFIFGSAPNAITGIVMIIVAAAAALLVRGADDVTAILAPPIGFLLITLTAGQVNLNASSITGRLVDVFFTLGNNWMWIVGSTGIALLIVALRRRRA
ncbi:MAG: hypothetical protein RJB01_1517, partial [Actinomycetota bacterium]